MSIMRGLACLCMTGLLSYGQTERLPSPPIRPEKGYFVQEIRDGLYVVGDGAYNTMFLVADSGVIVVDPLPTLGPRYLKAIAEVTAKPVTHIVYSHEHTDHIGAASLFPPGAVIIAHEVTKSLLARRADHRRPVPSVTFQDRYTLKVGGQVLEMYYPGANHQSGNIILYAPLQRVLMLVDVIYPGYMPYKNLGIVEDVQGYIAVHQTVLGYDFDTFVGGHVTRVGTRADVAASLAFVQDLQGTVARHMAKLPFPAYLAATPAAGRDTWDRHNEYERTLVDRCEAELGPRWSDRLLDTRTYLKDNCWAMLEAITVQLPPVSPSPGPAAPPVAREP